MIEIDKKFGKYVNPEVERKFLLAKVPHEAVFYSEIIDHYVTGTTLRLRRAKTQQGTKFKLAQKLRVEPNNTRLILHTNIYLSEAEYALLSTLPSNRLEKRRLTLDVEGAEMFIDQFGGPLEGLVIGEIDFGATGDPLSFATPSFAVTEVTDDERFTGAGLASTSHSVLIKILSEVSDIKLPADND